MCKTYTTIHPSKRNERSKQIRRHTMFIDKKTQHANDYFFWNWYTDFMQYLPKFHKWI